MDPLAGSSWSEPGTVAGFIASPPNPTLLAYAARRLLALSEGRALASRVEGRAGSRVLDIGCGAGRNAVPLALAGFEVLGTDLSWPMLSAAAARDAGGRLRVTLAPMEHLPVRDRSMDLVVAHGIWNLARSGSEFRAAVAEAARIAAAGAALFVFTFSRHTLPPDAAPIAGETFVFTQFSGSPQVFLTERQLVDELHQQGFDPDPDLPLTELNRAPALSEARALACRVEGPVIYQGGFRLKGTVK